MFQNDVAEYESVEPPRASPPKPIEFQQYPKIP
jgi:hypothetical protein